MSESKAQTDTKLIDGEKLKEVRACLTICLYNIIWAPADDYAAEVTAEQLVQHRTIIEQPETVPALLELALQAPVGFLESFDLPHDRAAIVRYLKNLRANLLVMLKFANL